MSHDLASQYHQIKVERTEILYTNGLSITIGSLVSALVTAALIWKFANHQALILWLVLIGIISGARLILVLKYQKHPSAHDQTEKWSNAYFVSAIAAGISWGLLSFVDVHSPHVIFQLIPFMIVALVLMAAIPSYSASVKSYLAFLISLVITTIGGLYYLKSPYHFTASVILLVYSPVLYSTARIFNKNISETLALKHQQTRLLNQLKTSNDQLSLANEELRYKQQILDEESQFAQHVLTQLTDNFHDQIPQIQFWLKSLDAFSGDLIQATTSTHGKHYLFLGDFTGHGLAAALGAVPASSIFNAMAKKDIPLEKIATELGNKLQKLLPVNYFCCAALMEINPDTGITKIINAGLPPVLQIDKKGHLTSSITSTNLPLGIAPCGVENINIVSLSAQVDDCFYLYSDGITEAENNAQEMWGELNFQSTLQKPLVKNSRLPMIKQQLTDFIQNTSLTDDVSILEYHVSNLHLGASSGGSGD